MDLTEIFYQIDEFCKQFENNFGKQVLSSGKGKRRREIKLKLSEVVAISIWYHYSGYKTFKYYYQKESLIIDFPNLVSYSRFIELKKRVVIPAIIMIKLAGLNKSTGISFLDSFSLESCHVKRASSHKTLKDLARKGVTSTGWFYGFKVHISINHLGEIIDFCITSGNVSDNDSDVLKHITQSLSGKAYADKGYILNRNLFEDLFQRGIQIIHKVRKNMKGHLLSLTDRLMLRKRALVESVISVLKEGLSIEHSRHRSIEGFLSHIAGALLAYAFRDKKPSITIDFGDSLKKIA